MKVEFHASIDDYVHVADRISASVPEKTSTLYFYYAFLFLNAIIFPVFLWFNQYLLTGLIVFLLNMGALMFLIPRVGSDSNRNYYEHLHGNLENEIATVELGTDGVRYYHDGCETFFSWRKITSVEETEQSIFFYLKGNGFAVRKNGFAYRDQEREFVAFANNLIQTGRSELEA